MATEETSKESTAVKQTNPSPTKVTAKPKESEKPKKEPSPRESEKKRKDEGKSPRIREKKKMKTEEERKDFKVSSEVTTSKGTRRKKRFEKLLEDVVFVISGFQNPLRGNIRNLALEMGAKYSPDWEDRCTHLM